MIMSYDLVIMNQLTNCTYPNIIICNVILNIIILFSFNFFIILSNLYFQLYFNKI